METFTNVNFWLLLKPQKGYNLLRILALTQDELEGHQQFHGIRFMAFALIFL
jgi:hypothetical protein